MLARVKGPEAVEGKMLKETVVIHWGWLTEELLP